MNSVILAFRGPMGEKSTCTSIAYAWTHAQRGRPRAPEVGASGPPVTEVRSQD